MLCVDKPSGNYLSLIVRKLLIRATERVGRKANGPERDSRVAEVAIGYRTIRPILFGGWVFILGATVQNYCLNETIHAE